MTERDIAIAVLYAWWFIASLFIWSWVLGADNRVSRRLEWFSIAVGGAIYGGMQWLLRQTFGRL